MDFHTCDHEKEGTPPSEWVPSKGRFLQGLKTRAAAQDQPAGKALPMLIGNEFPSPEAHIDKATKMDPFDIALEEAIPQQFKYIAYKCTWQPGEVLQQRERAVAELKDVSRKLKPLGGKWKEKLPEGSPARQLNLPLIQLLCKTFEYPDVNLPRDLAWGMPIVGTIPEARALQARAQACDHI